MVSRVWGLALVLAGCAKSATPAESAKADPASAPHTTHRHPGCGSDGLYALPPYEQEDVAKQPALSSAVTAFEAGHSAYATGDTALAAKKFFEAAHTLSGVPSDAPLADWALIARELAYHNALWSAAVAGDETTARDELQKTGGSDAKLAAEIDSLLADPPAECSK
jgi:hypothetical protein